MNTVFHSPRSWIERLAEILEPLALTESISCRWMEAKRSTVPRGELERQARIVSDLLGRENYATALRLMREWLVSWVIYQQDPHRDWLSPRRAAAGGGVSSCDQGDWR